MAGRSIATIALLAFPGFCQHPSGVLHSGEGIFRISVRGGQKVGFSGSCLSTTSEGASVSTKLEGVVPAEFDIAGAAVYLTVQNRADGTQPEIRVGSDGLRVLDQNSPRGQAGSWLEVEISKNGSAIKRQRTDAPHGVVSLNTAPRPTGSATGIELQVEGVRFALIAFTSETGDTEQQLVPVPFSRTFYAPEGSIVGLTAQKTRVTRPEPSHADGTIEVLDDGQNGELHVSIRVNGQPMGSAQTSEPYGVASTTIKVP